MDSLIAVIIITAINVVGWIYTKVFALGKLNEKVSRHEKLLNDGVVEDIAEIKAEVAGLTGTLNTYIDLTKNR